MAGTGVRRSGRADGGGGVPADAGRGVLRPAIPTEPAPSGSAISLHAEKRRRLADRPFPNRKGAGFSGRYDVS